MSEVLEPVKKKKKSKKDKFANLIGPTDPKQDHIARERLVGARIGLLLRHSFFGNLATRLSLVNADEWLGTAATDGRYFYYNSRFINMLKTREVEFLFGHEVLHVVYDHMGRRGDRDPQLWNIADDYCVNADLKKHRVGEFITSVPCLYDAKYEGKSAEEVYDDLYENAEKIDMDSLIEQMLDDHMDGEGEEGSEDGKGPKKMTQAEREQLKQEIRQAILSAAGQADPGSLPSGVARLVKDMTSPVMPWRELLQQDLTSAIRTDYSFMRPSRRSWHMDAVMPGMTPGEEVDIDVAIDMSGSISNRQANEFLSEIQGIMEAFDTFKINVFCFDTETYADASFTSENLDSIADYECKGGGGTDFDAIFRHLKNEGRTPKRLVVFTDGYPCGSWGDDSYCDTTWIIHGDKDPHPPFGTWALYDGKK